MRRSVRAALFGIALLLGAPAAHASSALDLVKRARAHEAAKEDDLALRRYMEALALDPTCEEAYLGLGDLRARRGDLREAEKVYSVALEHVPSLREARRARAYVRRALGMRSDAIEDLLHSGDGDVAALRVLASWYGEDGQTPAQLAVWRSIAARAEATQAIVLLHEARTMVKALVILVGSADPAASPPDGASPPKAEGGQNKDDRGMRRLVATLAKKGGF